MTIRVTRIDGNWISGKIDGKDFMVKAYHEPSVYGIRKGRVSKLWIDQVANYERGWDKKPETKEDKAMVDELVKYFENPANQCINSNDPPTTAVKVKTQTSNLAELSEPAQIAYLKAEAKRLGYRLIKKA